MSELSTKLYEITGNESDDELRQKLAENTRTIQSVLDGIIGERAESWGAVRRDGSLDLEGNITLKGDLMFARSPDSVNKGGIRRDKNGYIEYSHDGQVWAKLPFGKGAANSVPQWPSASGGDLPMWSALADLAVSLDDLDDVTIASAADGDELRYDDGAWKNKTITVTDVTALRDFGEANIYQCGTDGPRRVMVSFQAYLAP